MRSPASLNRGSDHDQRLAAIGVLAGGVAHDFNNILTAILGYGERALNQAEQGSRLRRDLESILAAGERGRSLVEQVLTIGNDAPGGRTRVDVEAEIRDAMDLVSARVPAGIAIDVAFDAPGCGVRARPNDLHRICMNLATNALHAMPRGGTLSVSVATQRVGAPAPMTVGSLRAGHYVVLRVSDSGTGIDPENLPLIFERFFTTRRATGGTGFGLSLVRSIALDNGGAIDVDSRPGAGTCFTVYLPRTAARRPR